MHNAMRHVHAVHRVRSCCDAELALPEVTAAPFNLFPLSPIRVIPASRAASSMQQDTPAVARLHLIEALKHGGTAIKLRERNATFASASIYADRVSDEGEEFMILAAVALPDGNYIIISRRLTLTRASEIAYVCRSSYITLILPLL